MGDGPWGRPVDWPSLRDPGGGQRTGVMRRCQTPPSRPQSDGFMCDWWHLVSVWGVIYVSY